MYILMAARYLLQCIHVTTQATIKLDVDKISPRISDCLQFLEKYEFQDFFDLMFDVPC